MERWSNAIQRSGIHPNPDPLRVGVGGRRILLRIPIFLAIKEKQALL
jgi:hypothetical protein